MPQQKKQQKCMTSCGHAEGIKKTTKHPCNNTEGHSEGFKKCIVGHARRALTAIDSREVDTEACNTTDGMVHSVFLLKYQYKRHAEKVVMPTAQAIIRLMGSNSLSDNQSKLMRVSSFCKKVATFTDLHFLIHDPSAFEKRMEAWEHAERKGVPKSNTDITKVLAMEPLEGLKSNESNLFAGRNTLANVE